MGVNHTSGPWEVNEYGEHREVQQVDPDGISIAIMSAGSREDARLIAAAPELLAACRTALLMIDPFVCDVTEIESAIAKAEGGAS